MIIIPETQIMKKKYWIIKYEKLYNNLFIYDINFFNTKPKMELLWINQIQYISKKNKISKIQFFVIRWFREDLKLFYLKPQYQDMN